MSASSSQLASTSRNQSSEEIQPKKLPKGVVLGKDGKPCRSCTSVASWMAMTKAKNASSSPNPSANPTTTAAAAAAAATATTTVSALASDCPPDVDELGNSTWTFLHTLTANYPAAAPPTTQSKTRQFLSLFSELYPCWVCAEDLQDWMAHPGNEPQVQGRDVFGFWMCRAHNAVNEKLGKPEFDCALWKQRWKDGWKDGRCD